MQDTPWFHQTALELTQALASGKWSSRELTQAHVDRIQALDGPINAVVARRFDQALEEAHLADDGQGGL